MAGDRLGGEVTAIWNKNFICVMLANFMLCLAHSAVNPLVVTYMEFLQAGAELSGFLAGMFFGVALAMRPVAGPVTTKLDKRRLLIAVFALGSVASAGYALFHSIGAFVVFRFLNGVQYSLVGSLIMTLAGDNVPKARLASGMGVFGISGAIGTAIAPAIGNGILGYGERAVNKDFGFTLVFAFAAVILALAVVPGIIMSPDRKSKADVKSTGAWYKNIFTIHALPMMIVLFLLMMPFSLYNTYVVEFAVGKGIARENISLFYLVLALTLAVSRPMSGMLTDRLGPKKVMFPSLVLFAASFIIIGTSTSLPVILIGAAVAAVGYGAAQPLLQAMCIQSETQLRRGVASNTIYIGIDLALFMGPVLGGFIRARSSYSTMFLTAIIPVVLGMICFAAVLPIHGRRVAELENKE